ncbi:MAG: uroporphyrinogen-III synthase [Deltaproteobacteria bacterium]|nr:uroporphyrinogen-III synthase [Deltaproteobacteria bacterium]
MNSIASDAAASSVEGPLSGRRVIVTRAPHQSKALRRALEAKGAEVLELPTIRIVPEEDLGPLRALLTSLEAFSATIFGSQNAVDYVVDEAIKLGVSTAAPVVCVGEKTAARLRDRLVAAPVFRGSIERPEDDAFRGEGVVSVLARRFGPLAGHRFFWPRAREGREAIGDALVAAGAQVDAVAVYRLVAADPLSPPIDPRLLAADAVLFLSGETLRCFFEVLPEVEARRLLARSAMGVIGPVAADKARALGIRVDVMPAVATGEALVDALAAFFRRDPRPDPTPVDGV